MASCRSSNIAQPFDKVALQRFPCPHEEPGVAETKGLVFGAGSLFDDDGIPMGMPARACWKREDLATPAELLKARSGRMGLRAEAAEGGLGDIGIRVGLGDRVGYCKQWAGRLLTYPEGEGRIIVFLFISAQSFASVRWIAPVEVILAAGRDFPRHVVEPGNSAVDLYQEKGFWMPIQNQAVGLRMVEFDT